MRASINKQYFFIFPFIMVFEQLFKLKWIERKEHAFFLGFIYSIIGLISAKLIFPANVGLMSIAFTSILLIPSLVMLLKLEENVEIREKKLSIKRLFEDHKDIFKVYIYMFLGIFLAYLLTSLLFPEITIQEIFTTQLRSAGIYGFATIESIPLFNLIINNLIVFLACFILSFFYGAGSILFLTWNASVWGIVFGFFAKQSLLIEQNKIFSFISLLLPFLPHMVTEALAYISAAIAGGVVSKAVLREKLFSKKFYHVTTDAIIFLAIGFILVILAGIIEVSVF